MIHLVRIFLKIGILSELAYRANFWVQIFESTLGIGMALGTVAIVFAQTPSLAGWQEADLICLLGIYFMVLGSINFVISPSLNKFMQDIVNGELDFTLTKPKDSQLLVSVQQFQIWKLVDVILGFGVLLVGISEKSGSTSLTDAMMFIIALACALLIIYSFWIILATLAFWFIRIENITQIFWAMYVAGRWPVGIYPGWLKWILTLLVPIAFAVTVPAQAISGKLDLETLLLAISVALGMTLLSRKFWLFGIRYYAGASA